MARILTGIQSTGTPHLGNILGAILPAIEQAKDGANDSYLFIADLHSLTQIKDAETLRSNTYSTAATWLAFGLDIDKTVFYRQSDVPQVTELSWYLNCFFPFKRLELAHGFKDNAVASRFHAKMGSETFVLPKADIQKDTMLIPGTDGSKMSKSKGNIIDIFLPEKKLRKQIMSIATDSTPLEEPKDWKTCNCFALYNLLASDAQISEMKANYDRGNYGYGHAKQALYELILERFSEPRERYDYYMNNLNEVDAALAKGAAKAKVVAEGVLKRVRTKLGY